MTGSTRANDFVTDTMGFVLHLERRRMSVSVRTIFQQADTGEAMIHIPSLVFAEMLYLAEKKRIDVTLAQTTEFLATHPSYQEYPLSLAVVRAAGEIVDVPELHDRLIAGTARLLNLHLLTNDPVIHQSAYVRALWE